MCAEYHIIQFIHNSSMERVENTIIAQFGTPSDWLMRSVVVILVLLHQFSRDCIGMAAHTVATDIEMASSIMSIVWATVRKTSITQRYNYLQPFDLPHETDIPYESTTDTRLNLVMCNVIFVMIKSVIDKITPYIPDWVGIQTWIDQFVSHGVATEVEVPFEDTNPVMTHWWGVGTVIINSFRTLSMNVWYKALYYAHGNEPVNIGSLLSLCDGRMMRDMLRWLHENRRMRQSVSSDHIAIIMRSMSRHDHLWWNYKWLAPYVLADIYGKPREYWDRFKVHRYDVLEDGIVNYLEYQCCVYERVTDKFPTDLSRIIATYQSDGCVWARY